MFILGINCVYHESSACLLENGKIVAVAEEERFNRVKHGKEARADNPDELPAEAIKYCLATEGISVSDLDHVACCADPAEIEKVKAENRPSAWNSCSKQCLFIEKLQDIPKRLREQGFRGDFHWVPHHTAHAASAFNVSKFDDAGVLVVDALGDDAFTTRFYQASQGRLEVVKDIRYPASIGYLWELFSVLLGFGVYDAAKVMGLAAYGDPARFKSHFDQLAWTTPDGGFDMAAELLRFSDILYYPPDAYCDGVETLLEAKRRHPSEPLTQIHHDIAAALQAKTNDLVMHMVRSLHGRAESSNLCLAGGVALNCVTNRYVFEEGPFERLYIQPAAHDGGTSLGAACFVLNQLLGVRERPQMPHAYLGPEFSETEIKKALRATHLSYRSSPDDVERVTAELISRGNVVGFFQGRMELGPRALGNRSILADPRDPAMRETLNRKVKHREYFRPLAPSVLCDAASSWFEIERSTPASDYMLMAYSARPEIRPRIPAVVHVDGTCRIQTVREETNPRFYRVIRAFEAITGVPVVLNTSFNDQEPIICSPADAIATFVKTEIDYLIMGDLVVAKSPQLLSTAFDQADALAE